MIKDWKLISSMWFLKEPKSVKEITEDYNFMKSKSQHASTREIRSKLETFRKRGLVIKKKYSNNRVKYDLKPRYKKKYKVIHFPKQKDLLKNAQWKRCQVTSLSGLKKWLRHPEHRSPDGTSVYYQKEIKHMKKRLKEGKPLEFSYERSYENFPSNETYF